MHVLVNECVAAKATALAYLQNNSALLDVEKQNFDNFHQHAKVGEVKSTCLVSSCHSPHLCHD